MYDALTPLRHVYGLEPGAAAPGAPGSAEEEVLRGARAALGAAPTYRPDAAVLAAVRERAAQASADHAGLLDAVRAVYEGGAPVETAEAALLSQTRVAVERAFAARPQPRPDAAVVDAVAARAAEASPEPVQTEHAALAPLVVALGGAGAPSAESEVLAQSLDALARVPRARPSADVLGAVAAFAATASADAATSGLDAVRSVYEGGAEPAGSVEVAVLEQTRRAVERAVATRPQPRPEAAAVDAVLARAAEATAARADEPAVSDPALAPLALAYGLPLSVPAPGGAEVALLAQTADALGRARPARPAAAVVQSVLARAASARRPARAARPAPADRAAASPRRRLPGPVWVSAAAFLLAALTGAGVLFSLNGSGGSPAAGPVDVATAETLAVPEVAAVGTAAESGGAEAPAVPPAAPPPSAVAPAPVTVAQATPAAAAPAERRPAAAARTASASPRPAEPPAWEVGEDVRALSLRLEEIDRSIEGLAWDEPPEVFGRPAAAATSTPGVQAVRAGAAPARARITPADSSRTPR